jgi:hypothetical protein
MDTEPSPRPLRVKRRRKFLADNQHWSSDRIILAQKAAAGAAAASRPSGVDIATASGRTQRGSSTVAQISGSWR